MISLPSLDMATVVDKISMFVKRQVDEAEANGVIVGLSGGLDSSTVAYLCVRALGSGRVLGLIMPDEQVTPSEDVEDAKLVAELLGIEYHLVPITAAFKALSVVLHPLYKPEDYKAAGNIRARVRMILLYYAANTLNRLVAGTGDKSEIMIGYFCYDALTRALTRDGLKAFNELRPGDIVFSLDLKANTVREVPLRAVYTFNYDGPMIHFIGKRTDLLVTPNHRMLIMRSDGTLGFEAAEKLLSWRRVNLPIPKPWKGGVKAPEYVDITRFFDQERLYWNANRIPDKLPVDYFLYLMGLYIGDGNCSNYPVKAVKRTILSRPQLLPAMRDGGGRFISPEEYRCEKPTAYDAYCIYFSIPKGNRARGKLEEVLKTLKIPYSSYANLVKVNSRALFEVFKLCGDRAENKKIPRWVLSYPSNQLWWLFKGLMDSDGWLGHYYQTVSYQLALNLVELCAKLGMHATLLTREPRVTKYGDKVVRSNKAYLISIARKVKCTTIYGSKIAIVHYKGVVWCPDVPGYHNLLVERNGKFSFCGNTKYGDGAVDMLPIGNLYKTQVKELARFLGVPERIAVKPSSPRLWKGQTAEQELGLSYDVIDKVLYAAYELKMGNNDIAKELNLPVAIVERVKQMVERSMHKKRLPPVAEV